MKYFTDIFLREVVIGSDEDKELAKLWSKAHDAYLTQLLKIQQRISKKVWKIEYENLLHDLNFHKLEIEQGNSNKHPTNVNLLFSDSKINLIQYKQVRCINFNFDEASNDIDCLGVHDCVASELLEVNDEFLSHELFFSSGAIIYLEFKKIAIK